MGPGFVINIEPSSLAGTLIARRDAQAFTPKPLILHCTAEGSTILRVSHVVSIPGCALDLVGLADLVHCVPDLVSPAHLTRMLHKDHR
jgi:hypothetical protein